MCSWDNVYSSYTYTDTYTDKEFKAEGLTGNKNFIWAAGVTAVIACAMTLIDDGEPGVDGVDEPRDHRHEEAH